MTKEKLEVWRKAYKKARRVLGIPRFERECRLTSGDTRRQEKAYKVPGTREHGTHCMLTAQARRMAEEETGFRWPFEDD